MKIGIAGGIGSGKSYVCQALRQRGYEVYDCDAAAKRLIRTSPDIRRELTALIGPDTYDAETGEFNKPKELRIQRVMERDHISREKVLEWMSRQYPQREVIQRADFVLVNDGKANIEHQLNKIIEQCNKQF